MLRVVRYHDAREESYRRRSGVRAMRYVDESLAPMVPLIASASTGCASADISWMMHVMETFPSGRAIVPVFAFC
jgi:hypothetical protein